MEKPDLSTDLLTQIGAAVTAHEADEPPLDPRLERLALGQLAASEIAALEREATGNEQLAAQIELFRPMSASSRVASVALSTFLPAPAAAAPPKRAASRVRWLFGIAAPTLAAAAAVVLLLRTHAPVDLPSYRARLTTADVTERGGSAQAAGATEGRQSGPELEIVLRPDHAPQGRLTARAFVAHDAALEPFHGDVEVSTDGAVRLRGETAAVFGTLAGGGARDVIVAIGEADDVPTEARVMQRIVAEGPDPSRLRVVTQRVLLAPPRAP